jgi:hypothetical protein
VDTLHRVVNIALVGKYTKLEDSYTSVSKALQHAAITAGYKLNIKVWNFIRIIINFISHVGLSLLIILNLVYRICKS